MKIRFIAALVLCALVASCGGCKDTNNKNGGIEMEAYLLTIEEAKDINAKSNLGLEYLSFSKLSEEDAKKYGPDHPEMSFTDDGVVEGYYSNYPWTSSDRRMTKIQITGIGYDFYGIKVGDDISTVMKTMTELGYEKTDTNHLFQNTFTETYIKHHVYIRFETNSTETVITSIFLSTNDPSIQKLPKGASY